MKKYFFILIYLNILSVQILAETIINDPNNNLIWYFDKSFKPDTHSNAVEFCENLNVLNKYDWTLQA